MCFKLVQFTAFTAKLKYWPLGDKTDIMIHGFFIIMVKYTSSLKMLFSAKLRIFARKWKEKMKRARFNTSCVSYSFHFCLIFFYIGGTLACSVFE